MFTVGAALKQSSQKYGAKPALIFGSERMTYAQLDEYSDRFAKALLEQGLGPGDRVGLLLPNGLEMAQAYFATAKAGIVGVPLNLRWSAPELAFALSDAEVGLILAGGELSPLLNQTGISEKIPSFVFGAGQGLPSWTEQIAKVDSGTGRPFPDVDDGDPAVLVYTSGTTGRPKGALRSHYSNVMIALTMASEFGIGPDDVGFALLPMFHVNSMWFVTLSMVIGATCVIYSERAFHPVHVVDEMNRFGVTYGMFVPSLLTYLADGVEQGKLNPSTLKVLLTSSAPLDSTLRDRLLRGFPGVRLFDIYGATEYGGASVMRHREDGPIGSVGYPAVGQEIRILDPELHDLPPGEIGEIYVKGPSLMTGYFHREEANQAAYTSDGFLTVGDMGYLTAEGLLYLVDRKQDMIIVSGENVYPKEVEDVLLSDPAVALAAVVGVPDPRRGERPVALIVARQPSEVDIGRLTLLCRNKLADYKRPVTYQVVDELPMGPAGKVIRRQAKAAYLART
jgi:long-chain acyl-CoA synthetase